MRLGACIIVFLVLAGAPAAFGDEPDVAGRLEEILSELDASSSAAVEAAAKRLRELGPDALPELVDAYWKHPARRLQGGRAERHASIASLAALSKAIESHGLPLLLAKLESYVEEHADGRSRLRALEILGSFGDESAMPMAVKLVREMAPEWRGTRRVAHAWGNALNEIMSKGMSPRSLRRTLSRMPEDLRDAAARVIGQRGRRSELEALVDLIDRGGAHVGPVLIELSRAPAVATRRLELAAGTRKHLQHGDRDARVGAAMLAGNRHMVVIFPEVAAQLEHEDALVRTATEDALRKMTSTSLGARKEAWMEWYESESLWLEHASIAQRLEHEDAGEVTRALREIAQHRLMGLTFVSDVRALLDHEAAGIRILACATLSALGDADAVPDLVGMLDTRNKPVRDAVWKALMGLTGESLPPDSSRWRAALVRWTS